jgi:transcriptional regulator with XRE-family HTH domain
MDIDYEAIGKRIQFWRKRRSLTQEQLVTLYRTRTGLPQSYRAWKSEASFRCLAASMPSIEY